MGMDHSGRHDSDRSLVSRTSRSLSLLFSCFTLITLLWNAVWAAGEACTGDSEQELAMPNPGAGLSSAIFDELSLDSTEALTVTVEWGTYSSDRVLHGHRLDNWLHFGASEKEKVRRREEVAAVGIFATLHRKVT